MCSICAAACCSASLFSINKRDTSVPNAACRACSDRRIWSRASTSLPSRATQTILSTPSQNCESCSLNARDALSRGSLRRAKALTRPEDTSLRLLPAQAHDNADHDECAEERREDSPAPASGRFRKNTDQQRPCGPSQRSERKQNPA